jgi:hypothetical protein
MSLLEKFDAFLKIFGFEPAASATTAPITRPVKESLSYSFRNVPRSSRAQMIASFAMTSTLAWISASSGAASTPLALASSSAHSDSALTASWSTDGRCGVGTQSASNTPGSFCSPSRFAAASVQSHRARAAAEPTASTGHISRKRSANALRSLAITGMARTATAATVANGLSIDQGPRLRLAQRYDLPPRPYGGEMDRRRSRDMEKREERDRNMGDAYQKWRDRQRSRPASPGWYHDDDPAPPRPRDVPPARPGNLYGRW